MSTLLFIQARRESGLGCYIVPTCILWHKVAWCTTRIMQDKNQISRYPRDYPSWSKAQVLFVWLGPLSVYLRFAGWDPVTQFDARADVCWFIASKAVVLLTSRGSQLSQVAHKHGTQDSPDPLLPVLRSDFLLAGPLMAGSRGLVTSWKFMERSS